MLGVAPNLNSRAHAPLERSDRELEVFEVAVKLIDLSENGPRLGRRNEAATAPREELRAERILGVFHEAAEPRRRDVEKPRGSSDRSRQHDRADNFDLTQGEHGELDWPAASDHNTMLRQTPLLVFDGPA